MTDKQKLDHMKAIVVSLEHTIAEGGPNATIALEQRGRRTTTGIVVFAKGVAGSPMGSVASEKNGTLTVVYSAKELFDFLYLSFTKEACKS